MNELLISSFQFHILAPGALLTRWVSFGFSWPWYVAMTSMVIILPIIGLIATISPNLHEICCCRYFLQRVLTKVVVSFSRFTRNQSIWHSYR